MNIAAGRRKVRPKTVGVETARSAGGYQDTKE